LNTVALKVKDLEPEIAYYTRLGLREISRAGDEVVLGSADRQLLRLVHRPDAATRPRGTAGLYHVAILLPDENHLGAFLRHMVGDRIPLEGAANHIVSQALYLRDPEWNGIEVYADSPREDWEWPNGKVRMTTDPLDIERLLTLGGQWTGMPAGTVLGHMHLNVGDLDRSQVFYEGLGMQVTADLGGFMRFMSWDGYHHHLGLNLEQGRGAAAVRDDVLGLLGFSVEKPDFVPETISDPDQVKLLV
jgi:catechol 2,3-dioxygenase